MTIRPLHAIVARSTHNVIGSGGKLPWSFPEDMRWFRQQTEGHALLMGRKTWQSIGKVLPGRPCVVVSSDRRLEVPGGYVYHDPELAYCLAKVLTAKPPMLIGGAELYKRFMPMITKLYVTEVPGSYAGDAFFPDIDSSFVEVDRQQAATPGLVFRVLERKL